MIFVSENSKTEVISQLLRFEKLGKGFSIEVCWLKSRKSFAACVQISRVFEARVWPPEKTDGVPY